MRCSQSFPLWARASCGCGCGWSGVDDVTQYLIERALVYACDVEDAAALPQVSPHEQAASEHERLMAAMRTGA
jgi:hypothetical protein